MGNNCWLSNNFNNMIITLFLKIVTLVMSIFLTIVPQWQVWPDSVSNFINITATTLANFNIIFPIDTFFQCAIFLINYFSFYLFIRLIFMGLNFLRGGKSLEI